MTQGRRYKNPPIEEALCEFRFKSGQDWDFTIPGKLQVQLKEDYSGKPRDQKALEIGLDMQAGNPANLRYNEGLARVQLMSEDGKRIVGVGPNTLSVHMLKPYQSLDSERSGWEDFKSRISTALDAYWDVTKPDGICRIGIRYINKITIPEKNPNIKEYLKSALPKIDGLPEKSTKFVSRIEYTYSDEMYLVVLQGLAGSHENHVEVLLDLDMVSDTSESINRDKALALTDKLRDYERKAFEAIITDKTRELFNAK